MQHSYLEQRKAKSVKKVLLATCILSIFKNLLPEYIPYCALCFTKNLTQRKVYTAYNLWDKKKNIADDDAGKQWIRG